MNRAALSGPRAAALVARRELRERARTRSFRVGTVVIAVLAAAAVLIPNFVAGPGDVRWTVGQVGPAPERFDELVTAAAAAQGAELDLVAVERGEPAQVIEERDLDALLLDGEVLYVDGDVGDRLPGIVSGAMREARLSDALAGAGVDPGPVLDAPPLATETVGVDRVDDGARQFLSFLGVLALLFAILSYGTWVLNSVLEEKSNRVMEIVVSTISPRALLAGKVIGNGLLGLGQFSAIVIVAVSVAAATGALPELPAGSPVAIASVLGWFVVGFAFYAVGFAAGGSLVSRQEDAQSAATPLTAVVFVAYFAALFLVNPDPGSTVARWVSLVPPIAPLAMPVRMASGDAQTWEVLAALALTIAATAGMVAVAASIYTRAILRTGARVPLREVLRPRTT